MEINVKNFELTDHHATSGSDARLRFIYPALQEFKRLNVPVSAASMIVKSIAAVEKALGEFDKTRVLICEQLCEKDDKQQPIKDNGKYRFSADGMAQFNEKFYDLLNLQISIDILPISQADISTVKEINIACYETLLKYGFIKDDTSPSMNGKAGKKELEAVSQQ